MSPGLPGLAISYLLYAILGIAKLFTSGHSKTLPVRVYISSTIAMLGLISMAVLAWWNKVDIPLAFILTQPLLLLCVLGVLALVRQHLKRHDAAASTKPFTDQPDLHSTDTF